jgi:hypothetical protein
MCAFTGYIYSDGNSCALFVQHFTLWSFVSILCRFWSCSRVAQCLILLYFMYCVRAITAHRLTGILVLLYLFFYCVVCNAQVLPICLVPMADPVLSVLIVQTMIMSNIHKVMFSYVQTAKSSVFLTPQLLRIKIQRNLQLLIRARLRSRRKDGTI